MGSGKSSVSRDLAKQLKAKRIDMDDEIIKISGLRSINEIFEKHGESKFREFETLALIESLNKKNQIIATGGGTLVHNSPSSLLSENRMSKEDKIVFLNATFETCKNRCQFSDKRPLFKDIDKARSLFNERLPLYNSIADHIVNIDRKTTQEVTKEIIALIYNLHRPQI